MNRIILASASPRRRELLAQIGISDSGFCGRSIFGMEAVFEVIPSRVEEKVNSAEPSEMVRELSAMKAEDVFAGQQGKQKEGLLVIGADTVVSLAGQVMGKPADEQDAVRMLTALQGKTHQVYTGVTLIYQPLAASAENKKNPVRVTFYEKTDVTMYPMSREEILDYVATGEPADKAGAYGIQGRCAAFIKGICGDYNNVVGLPTARLYQEIRCFYEPGRE